MILMAVSSMLTPLALAEAPMNTDDAGTLDGGGMKVEGVWSKDNREKGGELLFGFSPSGNLEVAVAVARARDYSANPVTQLRAVAFGVKWVPYQNKTGWSIGARLDHRHTRITDCEFSESCAERVYTITGLASYRLEDGQALHLNVGASRTKVWNESDSVGTWGIGYEFPLRDNMQLTAEAFGTENARPNKAIGLRYKIFEGFKISGAAGRGNGRSFGQMGFAWEF